MGARARAAGIDEAFVSEAALCDALAAAVRAAGWRWYPETSGWDAIAVLPDETQVGVQAKLRANVDVLAQCIPDPAARTHPRLRPGVDVRAVLVPDAEPAFRRLATALRVVVLRGRVVRGDDSEWYGYDGVRQAETVSGASYLARVVADAPRHEYSQREWLPPFEPDLPAGVPSPRSVTPWRLAAARLCAEIRAGLTPTAKDLAERGMALSRWRTWLDPIEGTRPRRYTLRKGTYLPDTEWPEVSKGLGLPAPPSRRDRWLSPGNASESQIEPTWERAA